MTKISYKKENKVSFSGIFTKKDIWVNNDHTVKRGRLAISVGKDKTIFKDCVAFANRETGNIEGEELIEGGKKVIVTGRLSLDTHGQNPREEIIIDSIEENVPVEVEVEETLDDMPTE